MADPVHPLILAFVADLFFSSRIESAAGRLDCRVHFIEHAGQLSPDDGPDNRGDGSLAALLGFVRARRPGLLVFDLNNNGVPWRAWIQALKADPDLGSIPVVAFGSHVDTRTMGEARAAGAQAVLARSRFVSALPEILEKYLQK